VTATQAKAERGVSGEMTLLEHLAELRLRLLRSILAILIGSVVGFAFYDQVLDFLTGPYKDLCAKKDDLCIPGSENGIVLDPLGGFSTRLRISTYIGILFAVPVILWQVWRFVAPGLYAKERRYAWPFMIASLLLFTCGAAAAWFTFPKALDWLVEFGGGVAPAFEIGRYVGFIALLMLGYGIGFLFPVVLVSLQLMGVVKYTTLVRQWRIWLVAVTVVGAVVTPGGDPISMIVLTVCLFLFYVVSIGIGWFVKGRGAKTAS
jgi:sec-independent protein translocase protein TatC